MSKNFHLHFLFLYEIGPPLIDTSQLILERVMFNEMRLTAEVVHILAWERPGLFVLKQCIVCITDQKRVQMLNGNLKKTKHFQYPVSCDHGVTLRLKVC